MENMIGLKRIFQLLVLLTAFQANAISLVAGPGWTTADPDFQASRQLLIDHLNATHYPAFLNGTGLKIIILHPSPLMLRGESVQGYASNDTINMVGMRAQLLTPRDCSAYEQGSADYLNCNSLSPSITINQNSLLSTFNHELFHVIDSKLQTNRNSNDPINVAWYQLNPPGFQYLSDALDSGPMSPLFERDGDLNLFSPSFITGYSSHTLGEDKADIFSLALVRPNDFFNKIAPFNPVLAAKYSLVRQMLNRITHNNAAIIPLPLQGQGN